MAASQGAPSVPDAVAPVAERAATAAVISDFDGTLSRIVDDPSDAEPLPGAVEVLHLLAGAYARVAVVSGRPASFLVDRLEMERRSSKLVAVGLYGIERAESGGTTWVDPNAEGWREAVHESELRAREHAPAGVLVEPKGLALGLHWRTSAQDETWAREFAAAQAADLGLVVFFGKMSLELRPPSTADKGTAVRALCQGLDAACFMGDDLGDLPAFGALDSLRAAGMRTCKMVATSEETPAALVQEADVAVNGPEEALAVLRLLLETARR